MEDVWKDVSHMESIILLKEKAKNVLSNAIDNTHNEHYNLAKIDIEDSLRYINRLIEIKQR